MEDDDEISDVFRPQQFEHSNKFPVESGHYTFPPYDAFHELDELGDSELFRCLPFVAEAMEEKAPVYEMEVSEMIAEMQAVKEETNTEAAEMMTDMTVAAKEAAETVVVANEVEKALETEVAMEMTDMEVKEITEMEAVKEGLDTEEKALEMTEMEVKEITDMEAVKEELDTEEKASETEVVMEMTEMEALDKELASATMEMDGAKRELETAVAKEATGMEVAKELSEMDVAKEALETEVVKEASVVEVMTEAPRPRKGGGKRKRGRATVRVQSRAPPKKKEEEDVCFICFDGGDLVLCDRRGCPKAYHPSCVNRDPAFFRARGRWNCGWHICSQCQKAAQYMCYTCTYSLCKGCIKEAEFVCVRGNKGFCVTCMRTVMLIEQKVTANKEVAEVDFDDKSNWEYLFKDYWLDLKGKLSITSEELTSAKNPWKGSGVLARNEESSGELYDANNDHGSCSDGSLGHNETNNSTTRKKVKKRSRSFTNEESSPSAKKAVRNDEVSVSGGTEWASSELLELVAHMKDGDKSVLSQYDVQALLLEYIKRNNLRDPRKKSQILCDSRLQSLFGKARVGHFEMLKLLESHFLMKDAPDDTQGGSLDGEAFYVEAESNSDAAKSGSDKRRKTRKRVEDREQQTNLGDYAAIDVHNINLVYLKRNLMEDLIDDMDKFQDTVVGSFVRIRISGTGLKQDMYRLVQVVGTGRAAEAYKTGKKTTYVMLEILNLNKTEVISIDTISNQEFSEEECKRLRQSIKCGFISRLTVGEIQEKAKALQAVRVKDWLDSEVLRLSHLRDRASENGRRKDLRECVEKLELLNTPEERSRRLQELPEVHADPNMDPSYISDEEGDQDDKKPDNYSRSRDAGFTRKGRDQIYPGKGGPVSIDGGNGAQKVSSTRWESNRNMLTKGVGWDKGDASTATGERTTESSRNQGRDIHQPNSWDTPKNQVIATGLETGAWNGQPVTRSGPSPIVPEIASTPSTGVAVLSNVSEADKVWNYQDPSKKIQGPFNMAQLRKWSKTGYFPADLRIWKTSEKREDSILLTDALIGKVKTEPLQLEPHQNNFSLHGTHNLTWTDKQQNDGSWKSNSKDTSGPANGNADGWGAPSSSLAAPTADLVNSKDVYFSQVRDSLKDSNAWSGHNQNHTPIPTTPSFPGQSHQMPFHHARDGQGGGHPSRWDSSQNSGSNWNMNKTSGFQSTSSAQPGEGCKVQENSFSKEQEMLPAVLPPTFMTEGRGADQGSRNDSSNLPTPTPKPGSGEWTEGQGTENMWSVSSTVQATSSGWGTSSTAGSTGAHQPSAVVNEPIKTASLLGEQAPSSVDPFVMVMCKDVASPSVLKATEMADGQQKTPPEHDALHSLTTKAVPDLYNVNLAAEGNVTPLASSGIACLEAKDGGITSLRSEDHQSNPLLGSKLITNLGPDPTVVERAVPVDGQGPDPPSSGADLKSADVPSHNPGILLQTTNDVSVKGSISGVPFSESLPSNNFVGQSNAQIGNWLAQSTCPAGQPSVCAVGSTASAGNIQNNLTSGTVCITGSAMEPAITVNTDWGTVPTEIPITGCGMMIPENSNQGWGPVQAQGNANMDWGIPLQGNTLTGWGTAAPGNTNTGWGTGVLGNTNMGWGLDAQGNKNVGRGTTTQGNANTGLASTAGNPNIWGNQPKHPGERFSGQGDRGFQARDSGHGGGRPWNRPSAGGGPPSRAPPRGTGVCKFHESGYCKKGASCNYLHT